MFRFYNKFKFKFKATDVLILYFHVDAPSCHAIVIYHRVATLGATRLRSHALLSNLKNASLGVL